MEGDEALRGKEALSGGHLCHVCGYQYPNANPSAKLRRSHRKNCRKVPAAANEGGSLGVYEREEAAAERNAGEGILLGEEGGEGDGASEANGGSALRGSAKEDGDLVEDKENAEHASPNSAGVQVISSECGETGLINCTNDSLEIANEGNGTITNLLLVCTNASQNKVGKHCSEIAPPSVGHLAEREDNFDEYQDASPFLHQSDSEDGAAVAHNSEFSAEEIKNLNNVSLPRNVAANEIPVETNVLCNDHFSREPSLTDLSADSKVGKEVECHLENRTPGLAKLEVSLKLESADECLVNVESNNTNMVDSKSDKTSSYCELIGELNASSLQKCSPLISDPESQSTCSRKVEGFIEDSMDVLHIMSEVSPRPEVVGSDNVDSETVTNSSTKIVPTGNESKPIHTENTTTRCTLQNWPVEDTSDVQLCVDNSCQGNSVCSVVGYQNDLAVTKVDGMLNSIAEDNCSEGISVKGSELDSSCEERPQPDDVEQIADIVEENHSIEKPNGFSNEEVCNKEINPEVPTKDQVSTSQEYVALLMDQVSCSKNPFNLDDTRSDDLFELDTDSYHLEASKVVESKQHVDSKSPMVDQLTVSNQINIAEGQHCLISDDRILAVSSTSENRPAVGADDLFVSICIDLAKKVSFPDASVNNSMQHDIAHTNGIIFAPSQVFPAEFSTMPTSQEINALSMDVEEKMQTEDTSTKEMTAVHVIDNVEEKKQTEYTTAKEMNAISNASNAEEEKLTEDTSAEMNAVQHTDGIEGKKHAEDTGATEVSALRSMENVEEKNQAEDTGANGVSAVRSMESVDEKNAISNARNAEEEKLTEDTSAEMNAVQHTDDIEGKKHAEETGATEVSALRSMENVEEKNQAEDTGANGVSAVRSMESVDEKNRTEDTSAKKMNAEFNADDVEDRKQTDDTSAEEMNAAQRTDNVEEKKQAQDTSTKETNAVRSTDNVEEKKQTEDRVGREGIKQNEEIAATGARLNSGRIHVPLKVLLAEASAETKEEKNSTKELVLSFRRRVSKGDASSVKSGSPKAGSGDQYWDSPARLPHNNVEKRSKGRKRPWAPFICCHSVH